MKRRNIVVFTNTLLSGGAEKQALLLTINLKKDHNVLLVVYYGDQIEDKFREIVDQNNITVKYLYGNHLKKIITFWKILRENKVFVIFSYLLTTNFVGAIVGKLAGVPVRVGGIRNAKIDKKKLPVQRFINNNLSTHTIFNNYNGIEQLSRQGFDTTNAIVIPNCFELTTKVIQRAGSETVNIITVGRFVHQKGYFEALKVMEALKKEGIKFKYYIIGFGELEIDLRKEIEKLQLNDVVEMVINPPNIPNYYTNSDIYLCTSYFEGLSNTIMEALSYSLPVVATNVGDNNRLVHNGVNGFIIDECKFDLFLGPLKNLIKSVDLRNKFGEQSFRIIRDNYSGPAFKENYEKLIARYN